MSLDSLVRTFKEQRLAYDMPYITLALQMADDLAALFPQMELIPDETADIYGTPIILLGVTSGLHKVQVGNMSYEQSVYLGSNGVFYVEGPRKTITGKWVIDTELWTVNRAIQGDKDQIPARVLVEMLAPYFI